MPNYLNEAWKSLESLNEDIFTFDREGLKALDDFREEDFEQDTVDIIDPEADYKEELEDTYVGKVILKCNCCGALHYKRPEEVVIETEKESVNTDEECPLCNNIDGFKIVGEVVEFHPEEAEEKKEEEFEEKEEEEVSLNEDFQNVFIETDTEKMSMTSDEKGKTTIITEPKAKEELKQETIAPVSDEIKIEIEGEKEVPELPEEEAEESVEEFDEESFDELEESYLKSVYENVESYKTSSVKAKGNSLMVEGIIKFASGKQSKTSFLLEAKDRSSTGKVRFVCSNKQITESKNPFILRGRIEEGKFLAESFNYNYRVKGQKDRIYGTVRI